MSKGKKSPGGRATSGSAAQTGSSEASAALGSNPLPRRYVDAVLVDCCAGLIPTLAEEAQALLSVALLADVEEEQRDALTSAAMRITSQIGFLAARLTSFTGSGQHRVEAEAWFYPQLADEVRLIAQESGLAGGPTA